VQQIRASDIDFWKLGYKIIKLRHEKKIYPPRVKMIVIMTSPEQVTKLPIKFAGCAIDDQLDVELVFPLLGETLL
jgi:hypothetical protein